MLIFLVITVNCENTLPLQPKSICEENPGGLPEMNNGISLKHIPLMDSREDVASTGGIIRKL